jgi:hypothetical protein
MIIAINKPPIYSNRFELDFSSDTKAHRVSCASGTLFSSALPGLVMVARRTPRINSGSISLPPAPFDLEKASITSINDFASRPTSGPRDASGRKLRNRLMLVNVIAWIAIVLAVRLIFF